MGTFFSFLNASNTQKVNSFLEDEEITMRVPFVKGSSMRARKDASDLSMGTVHCEACGHKLRTRASQIRYSLVCPCI